MPVTFSNFEMKSMFPLVDLTNEPFVYLLLGLKDELTKQNTYAILLKLNLSYLQSIIINNDTCFEKRT